MREAVTIEISNQLSEVLSVIERHLESTLLAVHLYGSAVDGGLHDAEYEGTNGQGKRLAESQSA